MKIIAKLDAWLIARPYQGLIDLSGKSREWWMEQSALATFVGGLANGGVLLATSRVPGWMVVLQALAVLVMAASIFLDSREPIFLEKTGQLHGVRRSAMVIYAVSGVFEAIAPSASTGPWIVLAAGLVSSFYFAACQPPKPREPRRKLQQTV